MGRFVKPTTVRVPLSGGDFIDIKQRLTHGEREDLFAQMMPFYQPGEKVQLDSRAVRTATVLAYLVGWSLTDGENPGEGTIVPMSPAMSEADRLSTLKSLDPDTFDEIYQAIDSHDGGKKTAPATAPASSATSPSPE